VKKTSSSHSRGPFSATLARLPGKGGWTYLRVPKKLVPPVTRAWNRTPIRARLNGIEWDTSVWRSKIGDGFLPVPKRIRGELGEGDKVRVAFSYVDD
jgi:hypothetical protein